MKTKRFIIRLIKVGSILIIGIIAGVILTFYLFGLSSMQDAVLEEMEGPFTFKDIRIVTLKKDNKEDYLAIGKGDYWFLDITTDDENKKAKVITLRDESGQSIFGAVFDDKQLCDYILFNNEKDIVCGAEKDGERWTKFYLIQKTTHFGQNVYWYDLNYDGAMDLKITFDSNEDPVDYHIYYQEEWIRISETDFKVARLRKDNAITKYSFDNKQGWIQDDH